MNPNYTVSKVFILLCWLSLVAVLFFPIFKNSQLEPVLRALIWLFLVAIIVGTMIPSNISKEIEHQMNNMGATVVERLTSDGASSPISETMEKQLNYKSIHSLKYAHFFLFTMLTLTLLWGRTHKERWYAIFVVTVLAFGTELSQFYIEGRNPLPIDIAIDLAGAILGATTWLLLMKRISPL